MKKKLPIGVKDFKELITGDYYYIDKSKFIEDVFTDGTYISGITRPRKFGKTLNLSMLKYFFDIENAAENRKLFKGLYIEDTPTFEKYQGQYPVLYFSFKGITGKTHEEFKKKFEDLIVKLYKEYAYIKEKLEDHELKWYEEFENRERTYFKGGLFQLTWFLKKYYGKKVIVLIDEYDTPILDAYKNGHFDKTFDYFRSVYGNLLKGNNCVKTAVAVGNAGISAHEFSSLIPHTIFDRFFKEDFGFTENDVQKILKDFGLEDKAEEVKKWYGNYKVDNIDLYTPYSVINYADSKEFKIYWAKIEEDDLAKHLFSLLDKHGLSRLQKMLEGDTMRWSAYDVYQVSISSVLDEYDPELLLLLGYFSLAVPSESSRIEIKIYNEEVRTAIKEFSDKHSTIEA